MVISHDAGILHLLCEKRSTSTARGHFEHRSIKRVRIRAPNADAITPILTKNKVVFDAIANRFYILNGLIPLNWLNSSSETLKINCKK